MSNFSRTSIPEEFYDWTSAKLLVQPEPQYIFAELVLKALGASLAPPSEVGLPGRTVGGAGADYANVESGRLNLEPDMLSENLFATAVNFDGAPGDAVRLNRPKYTDSTYTQASRVILPETSISTTGQSVGSEQAVITLKRFGGPYNNTAGAIRPFVIDQLMAKMGVHNLVKMAGLHLVRDFHKTLDTFLVQLGMDGATTLYPRGMTAANDATATAQYPLTYETLSRTAKYMDEDLKLPVLPDGRRVIVVTPTGLKQLKDDPQYARYSHDFAEKNPLFNRYTALKAVLPEFYIFASSTLDITANTSSVNVHTALAMAPGAFGMGMGERPMVRNSTADNYGLSVPVVWTAVLGPALLDNRFVVKVAYSADVN